MIQGPQAEHTNFCHPLEACADRAASHQCSHFPDGETEAPRGQTGPSEVRAKYD